MRARPLPLPAGFTPVVVVRCSWPAVTSSGRMTQVPREQFADHDLGAFIAQLRRRSGPRTPPPGTACPLALIAEPYFAVLDAHGHVFYPLLPTGRCGLPYPQVLPAFWRLPWRSLPPA